ncbi:MAG: hypothetical protein CMF96_01610 [Candidatus Marinimicrobia bacterium]|nr:hypothetical protein [Candidatus Neomarinimicrobiota bacterium]
MTNSHRIVVFATLVFGGTLFSIPIINGLVDKQQSQIELLIGLRVQFSENNFDQSTSGNENFIFSPISSDIEARCSGFIVDSPPHDKSYFKSQMSAVSNYFNSVSNGNILFDIELSDSILTADNQMSYYAGSDLLLGDLFTEAIEGFEEEIENILYDYFSDIETGLEKSIIVLFHAGIGQDFSVPFLDPTPNDLSSAYIEESMLSQFPKIAGIEVRRGILLPETQNHIFYDAIEDIFPGEVSYCNYQVGMTGIFSFLVGYALGLPALFDVETGSAGVGVFGLMDHGSNNGRGVIPAPPTAWTRIHAGWVEPTILNENGQFELKNRDIQDQVFKIPISSEEYFLIEQRDNSAKNNNGIEEIRYQENDNSFLNWFDVLNDSISNRIVVSSLNVIESVDNYDLGLPETGILIWHIQEPINLDNINSDRYSRAVHLEEADGAIDIGFETFNPFFTNHLTGWGADMWFPYNSQWELANSDYSDIEFSNTTTPNSRSRSGVITNIKIFNFEKTDSSMIFSFEKNTEIPWETLFDVESVPVGGSLDNVFLKFDENVIILNENNEFLDLWTENDCLPDFNEQLILNLNGVFDCMSRPDSISGFFSNHEELEYRDEGIAVGDLDLDGLDEIFKIENELLICENSNSVPCDGFPVYSGNSSSILIANILFDEYPEIILKDGYILKIISHTGETIVQEIVDNNYFPIIIPNWSGNYAGLIDGNKIYKFEYDEPNSYWLTKFGKHDGTPISSGYHFMQELSLNGISKNLIYNYPNPVVNGLTTFRFFNYNASSVEIKIISSNGQFIEKLYQKDLTQNEYNEVGWSFQKLNSGIYLAEIKPNVGQTYLVHVMVIEN